MSWKAGTASTVITPHEPFWLAGYAARTQPARDRISDLYCSVVALEDPDGQHFVVASIDLIGITRTLSEPIFERVHRAIGLSREQLLLTATHTHYGPEFRPDKALFFKVPTEYAAKIPQVAATIAGKCVQVIIEAVERLAPARIFARRTTAAFAHNRRREGVKGGTPSPHDVLDHEVPMLDVLDANTNRRKAIVFGYACHNTTIPPEDCRYCADWAGFAAEALQQNHPGVTTLFIPGCGADQNPEPRGSIELSEKYGHELAENIHATLQSADAKEITGPMRIAFESTPLPLKPITRSDLDAMLASDDAPKKIKAQFLLDQLQRGEPLLTEYPAPIQAVRFGNELLLIALSGETVVDWSHKFKKKFARLVPHLWIAGYCNDLFGYVPTRRIQLEGGYEADRANLWSWVPSPFTDDLEDRLTDAVTRLVAGIS